MSPGDDISSSGAVSETPGAAGEVGADDSADDDLLGVDVLVLGYFRTQHDQSNRGMWDNPPMPGGQSVRPPEEKDVVTAEESWANMKQPALEYSGT